MRWPALAGRGHAPLPVPASLSTWVERGSERLDDATVERLALALHERRHGNHTPERGNAACARASGAFDDVYAIEPLIVALIGGGR